MAGYIGSKTSVSVVSPETDSRYVNVTGDTMTGALALPSGGLNVGTDQLSVDSAGRVTMPYQPAFMAHSGTYTASGNYYFNSYNTSGNGRFNRGNHFNASTGVFTAPVAGVYLIGYIFHDIINTAARHIGRIYVNGSITLGYPEVAEGFDTYEDIGGSVLVNLSANDTVQWATHPAGQWSGVTASAALIG